MCNTTQLLVVAQQVCAEHGSAALWRDLGDSQHSGSRIWGNFRAKLGLCSRKEGETLQKPIKSRASWSQCCSQATLLEEVQSEEIQETSSQSPVAQPAGPEPEQAQGGC